MGRLIGVDRDRTALAAAKERLAPYADRVTLVHSNFAEIDAILDSLGIPAVDGMLFDLGVSSPQLDDASRGFSYMADAPLDMRMDKDDALTAGEVVNTWPQGELRRILYDYGEERYAPQIAAAICRAREKAPIETTLELVDIIRSAMPAQALREKQHPAKRSFQAIRIAVNDELGAVSRMMQAAVGRLNPGRKIGRHHLPFARGPHRQERDAAGGARLHLSAGIPGVRLRQKAARETRYAQAYRLRPCGAGGKSPRPERKAPRCGKALTERMSYHGRPLSQQRLGGL